MHVPDGFFTAPTSVTTGVVAAVGVGVALKMSRRELDERATPMAGLVAAFIFAGQMINFPVGGGTSGHLIGAGLAAVLVGPWTAVLCMSVVLVVQALLMADGGITALGTNITLMAMVAVVVAWALFKAIHALNSRSQSWLAVSAAIAAGLSVPVTAAVFAGLFAVGGEAPISLGTLLAAMVSVHALIGVGEAVITGLVVGAVASSRPDLVYALKGVRAKAQERAEGASTC